MKTFAYASLGILALTLAFHLGAATATTSTVDHSASGVVAACMHYSHEALVLDENGIDWSVTTSGWVENPDGMTPLPVPLSEVKLWHSTSFVTYDDHVWVFLGGTWNDFGVWPGATSATKERSWGAIKDGFR